MKIRLIIFCCLILFFVKVNLDAKIPVFFDCNRFLAENNKNTLLEITYKIFHKDLVFKEFKKRLSAQIWVTFKILNKNNKELYKTKFPKRISSSVDQHKVNPEGFFIDKIKAEITPDEDIYHVSVMVQDHLSKDSITWKRTIRTIPLDTLTISDIEINSFSIFDTTDILPNFKRNNRIFLVNPNHLLDPSKADSFNYYFEIYPGNKLQQEGNFYIKVTSEDDSVVFEDKQNFLLKSTNNPYSRFIPVKNWEPGTYILTIDYLPQSSNKYMPKDTIKISKEELLFVPQPIEDIKNEILRQEYEIVRYFLSNTEYRFYKSLDKNGRIEFIKSFWRKNDPNPKTEKNEFKEIIEERVNYAKKEFAYFGNTWKTDRSRVYIRNGSPEEIIEKSYDYRAKPYIIWKYYTGEKRVYLFVDFSGQGNYKLVYVENDPKEITDPLWESYVGPYFEESQLE